MWPSVVHILPGALHPLPNTGLRSHHLPAGQVQAQGRKNNQTAFFSHTSLHVIMSHRPQITSSGPLEGSIHLTVP